MKKGWLFKTVLFVLGSLLIATLVVYLNYSRWKTQHLQTLSGTSQLAETSVGNIQFGLQGSEGSFVLWVHGTPGGFHQTPPPPEGWRTITPSRPGYLGTRLDVGREPERQAMSYAALLDVQNVDAVVVFGISGGGPSALSFAASYPERTEALVLISPVTSAADVTPMPQFLRSTTYSDLLSWLAIQSMLTFMSDQDLVESFFSSARDQEVILGDPELLDVLRQSVWTIWPPTAIADGWNNDYVQGQAMKLDPSSIRVPTLVVHGTDDKSTSFAGSQDFAAQIPGAIFTEIEGADHLMILSHRDAVTNAISQFLLDTTGRSF